MIPPHVELRALGTLGLTVGGADAQAVLSRQKHVALLLYLALATPRESAMHRRDTLLALLWPELGDAQARAALNKGAHQLRRELGEDVLVRPRAEELGIGWERFRCDVREFDDAIARGDHAAALALYGGELLPGFHVREATAFMDWLEQRRRSLRRQAVESALKLAEDPSSVAALQRAREIDPLDERVVRALIARQDAAGERTAALRTYDEFAAHLRRELETDPTPATRQAIDTIRKRGAPRVSGGKRPTPRPLSASGDPPVADVAPAQPRRVRRVPRLLVAGVLLVLGAATAWGVAKRAGSADSPPPMSATTVAVMPFEVLAPREHAYLAEGIATLLGEQLDGAGVLKSVSPRLVMHALDSARAGADVAKGADGGSGAISRRFGAGLLVEGKAIETAGQMFITATLTDRINGREVFRGTVNGPMDQVFQLVSQLAVRIAAAVSLEDSRTRLATLEPLTQSPVAVRELLDGERAYRAGAFASAIQAFRRAAEADTAFALAHWRLAMASMWSQPPPIVHAAIERASLHSGRLSVAGRNHVRALRHYVNSEFGPALSLYEELLRNNPNDADAWAVAAEVRHHEGSIVGHSLTRAADSWRRVLALEPGNASALLHLLVIDARDGDRSAFERDVAQLRLQDLDADRRAEIRILRAHAFGDSTARRALDADLQAMDLEAIYQRAVMVTPDLRQIDENFTSPMIARHDRPEPVRWLLHGEALVAAARGEYDTMRARLDSLRHTPQYALETEAEVATIPNVPFDSARLEALRESLARPPAAEGSDIPSYRFYLGARLALRAGDVAGARRSLGELQRAAPLPAHRVAHARLVRLTRAFIAAQDGRHREALATLGAPELGRHSWSPAERLLRAELHDALGEGQAAHQWYETFPAIGLEDVGHLPYVYRRNAALYEREGNRSAATAWSRREAQLRAR